MSHPKGFRIVHAIAQLRFGAGRYVVDTAIAQHGREPGCVAVVLSADAEQPWRSSRVLIEELSNAGVAVFWCGDFFHRTPTTLKAAAQSLRDAISGATGQWPNGSVVHAHTAMAATVARWAGAPRVVLTCHGWGPDRPAEIDLQDALAYSLCDRITCPSEQWAAIVRERTAVENVSVIPYGFNLDRLRDHSAEAVTRAPRIVCVAELSRRKGVDLLLEAMPLVWSRVPQAELHLIGDGEMRDELRSQAMTLDETGARVVFHGMVDDPTRLLRQFDVFALATRSDNQPVAIIEAMAAGLPVVATRVGGIPDLIEGARCGFVVPPENVYELGMALSVLAETSDEGRRELGAAGAAEITRRFDMTHHITALDKVYGASPRQLSRRRPHRPHDGVRLHLGCDTDYREGWINVDMRPEVEPDVVASAHVLSMFADGTVDAIEACHMFEHLPLHVARAGLREWARVLRTGGELLLELPNLDACIRMLNDADPDALELGMGGIFGWPAAIERIGPAMVHQWGWSPRSLTIELERYGFGEVEVLPVTQTWRPATRFARDFRICARRLAKRLEAAA